MKGDNKMLKGTAAIEYPEGAIRDEKQLSLLVGSEIWIVSQGGRISKCEFLKITSYDEIYNQAHSPEKDYLLVKYDDYQTGNSMKDYNILGLNGYNAHFVFADEQLAENYSKFLKENEEYQNSVNDWHKEVALMFKYLDE